MGYQLRLTSALQDLSKQVETTLQGNVLKSPMNKAIE